MNYCSLALYEYYIIEARQLMRILEVIEII